MEQKSRQTTHIRIIYGKRDLKSDEREWIDSIPSIELCFRETLHAKLYLNEKQAVLTSMNLYQFSEKNNDEMGILVSKTPESDRLLYAKISKEAEHIADLSEKIREVPRPQRTPRLVGWIQRITQQAPSTTAETIIASEPVPSVNSNKEADAEKTSVDTLGPIPDGVSTEPRLRVPAAGFCIRCETDVPANPAKPYCNPCYRTWNRYKNEEYEEVFCHLCGDVETTSMAKPLCLACYRTYRDAFA